MRRLLARLGCGRERLEYFRIVHDPGLADRAFDEAGISQCFLARIARLDQPFRHGIADGRFVVATFAGHDLTDFPVHIDLLRADFRTY